jgi:hypothetical protein
MPLRVLFADDQIPLADEVRNECTRQEIVRLKGPMMPNVEAAYQEDHAWFTSLIDYLERTRGLTVIRAKSFQEAAAAIKKPETFDVAVIDLSWTGDPELDPEARHNIGRKLIAQLSEVCAEKRLVRPVIAFSQNFQTDFELMSTMLELGAMPIPKSYNDIGKRILYFAIRHLERLHPASDMKIEIERRLLRQVDQLDQEMRDTGRRFDRLLIVAVAIALVFAGVTYVLGNQQDVPQALPWIATVLGFGGTGGFLHWAWKRHLAVRKEAGARLGQLAAHLDGADDSPLAASPDTTFTHISKHSRSP